MKPFRSLLVASIAVLALNAHAVSPSIAIPTSGEWVEFDFDAAGSSFYDLTTLQTSFSFTLSQSSLLRIVDLGFSGDRFSISLNGNTLGTTSAAVIGSDQMFTPEDAWNDSRYSKGQWLLAAGSYTLHGTAIASPEGGGFGVMSITAVPEPESWGMLLAGLGVIGAIARRRAQRA